MDKIYQVFQNRKYVVITIVVVLLAVSTGFYLIFSKANVQKVSDIKIPTESNIKDTTSGETPDSYIPNDQSAREDKLSTESSSTSKEGMTKAKVAVPTGYTIVDLTDEEQQKLYEEIRTKAPINPTDILAKASSDPNAEELQSEGFYSYPNPVFTWSGERVQEQGVKITGYMVYFGNSYFIPDFINEAKFQTANTYTAANLQSGKTYYLVVRVVTDSQIDNQKYGYEEEDGAIPARPIFVYKYR